MGGSGKPKIFENSENFGSPKKRLSVMNQLFPFWLILSDEFAIADFRFQILDFFDSTKLWLQSKILAAKIYLLTLLASSISCIAANGAIAKNARLAFLAISKLATCVRT
ncbi:MAG TPA: hypothetical protein DCY88_31790 [Cyanobacteria bacterium UBA11372]|nr:hypothetical protein [Cyanobacteria bacterium UBA11372]